MESITNQAAEQFRNNIEDRIPTEPEVMSRVEETKDGGEAEKMTRLQRQEEFLMEQIELLAGLEREKREVQGAAEQIKIETQKLQQHTTSQSDPKVTHRAGFIQTMSEEMLKQKERLSDNKMSVKETCREVKIVLQQITDLVEDKLQSLSEDAKLKLESLIKNFRKMTASMWKLMFCTLLLYRLREVLDSLKSDSYNISLSRGRLKYAFKMASMLALWLSHDVETNPGPEFNRRTCFEMLIRRFSESFKANLKIRGTIWSDKVAKAAYKAGYSNNFRWKNPSGKNKESLPDLIERAKELGRVLKERNCLPRDLAPFAVNLDHQETQDRLRQHLMAENLKAAADLFTSERYLFPSTIENIDCVTQLLKENVSNSKRHHTARPPPLTPTHSEFGHLADSQSITNTDCETNSIISNIVTRYQSKRSQRKKNKNPKTKQISNVTASELCTATGIPCHDMLTGGTMVEGAETDSSPGRLSNSLCTLSTSTPDTSDTPRQDQDIIEAETTGNSDFVRMTLEIIRENEMKSTPGTSGTDSSHASIAEHAMISDNNSFDETNFNNDSEVPNQEGRRNVDLVSPSPRSSCDVNGGVEMPGDILGHISLTPDTPDDIFNADLSSRLLNFMQGDDVNTAVTDTDTEMNDVPLPTDTADEALLTSIGNDPFSVMTGDYRKTSSSDALNPDNSPDDETQQDAADEGSEDEETDSSQPLHEAAVPIENNQLDQPNTATDRCQDQNEGASREERTERHESQSVAGLDANRRNITSTDTETAGTDTEMRVITAGTDNEMHVITAGTDNEMRVITAGTDNEMRVITAGTDNKIRVITAGTDTEIRVITAGTDNKMRVITAGTDTEIRVITAGTDTEIRVITAGTSTHVSEIEPQADERKSAEENEYITKSEFQAFRSQQYVSNSGTERRLQKLEASNGLVKASTSYRPDLTLNQQVHLGESDTSLGSISASEGATEEAGRHKRKRRQQHPPTKKKRQ